MWTALGKLARLKRMSFGCTGLHNVIEETNAAIEADGSKPTKFDKPRPADPRDINQTLVSGTGRHCFFRFTADILRRALRETSQLS